MVKTHVRKLFLKRQVSKRTTQGRRIFNSLKRSQHLLEKITGGKREIPLMLLSTHTHHTLTLAQDEKLKREQLVLYA